ncbi:MAG: 3-isopropylmalate dehydratase small subunit [Elusimicrobia bacterium]|nr:3-isopropylmalate dehydratase small subunit [Elusimicrobiota bacterium]
MSARKVVLKVADDVSTDIIYPGRFMATVLPAETPMFAFADNPDFNKRLKSGEIPKGSAIVAGNNFGCGSSREQAVSCLKGYDLLIVARNISRIFLQSAINLGLNIVICPEIEATEGDELEVDGGKVYNRTTGKSFATNPLPKARQAIIDAGGLIPYTRKLVLAQRPSKK